MKTLYLDCQMGAAGDMLMAALLELHPEPDRFIEKLNTLGIPNVKISREIVKKCGICGTYISVKIDEKEEHHHHIANHNHNGQKCSHNRLQDIQHIIHHLNLSSKVTKDILAVYSLIAEAESSVHGVPVSDIHFHEVGTLDAITDIAAVCLLMDEIAPSEVIVSPIHVGSGHVHCAHGILPVPAPATAHILKGIPIYGGGIKGELCTPTGAALLKYFATGFGKMPTMCVSSIGYGMGKKDFEAANCIRAMLGETIDGFGQSVTNPDDIPGSPSIIDKNKCCSDKIYELSCNVDDMTAERIGYALEQFLKDGALDAFTIPVLMKKSRPGTLIRVICSPEKRETLIRSMFRHTTTCGIREIPVHRSILNRQIIETSTKYGTIRRKDYWGYGVSRSKYEYQDLASFAEQNNLSIEDIIQDITQ